MGTMDISGTCRDQKRAWIPWKHSYGQLKVIMWVLGTELGFSAGAASVLDYWVISPVPSKPCLKKERGCWVGRAGRGN